MPFFAEEKFTASGHGKTIAVQISSELIHHLDVIAADRVRPDSKLRMLGNSSGSQEFFYIDDNNALCIAWNNPSLNYWKELAITQLDKLGEIHTFHANRSVGGEIAVVLVFKKGENYFIANTQFNEGAVHSEQLVPGGINWIIHDETPFRDIASLKLFITHVKATPYTKAGLACVVMTEDLRILMTDLNHPQLVDISDSFSFYARDVSEVTKVEINNFIGLCINISYKNTNGEFRVVSLQNRTADEFRFVAFPVDLPPLTQAFQAGQSGFALAMGAGGLFIGNVNTSVTPLKNMQFFPAQIANPMLAPGLADISDIYFNELETEMIPRNLFVKTRGKDAIYILSMAPLGAAQLRYEPQCFMGNSFAECATFAAGDHIYAIVHDKDGKLSVHQKDSTSGYWKNHHIALRAAKSVQQSSGYITKISLSHNGVPAGNQQLKLAFKTSNAAKIWDGSQLHHTKKFLLPGVQQDLVSDRNGVIRIYTPAENIHAPGFAIQLLDSSFNFEPHSNVYKHITSLDSHEKLVSEKFAMGPNPGTSVFTAGQHLNDFASDMSSISKLGKKKMAALDLTENAGEQVSQLSLFGFLEYCYEQVKKAIVEITEEGFVRFIIKLGEEVLHTIIKDVEAACHLIKHSLERMALDLGKVLSWLGCQLLGLNKSVALQQFFVQSTNDVIDAFEEEVETIGALVKDKITTAKKSVDDFLNPLIPTIEGYKGNSDVHTSMDKHNHVAKSPAFEPTSYGLDLVEILSFVTPTLAFNLADDKSGIIDRHLSSMEKSMLDVIKQIVRTLVKEFKDTEQLFSPGGENIAYLFDMLKGFIDGTLNVANDIVSILVDLLEISLQLFKDAINSVVESEPIKIILEFVRGLLGLKVEIKPTLLNLITFVPAIMIELGMRLTGIHASVADQLKSAPFKGILHALLYGDKEQAILEAGDTADGKPYFEFIQPLCGAIFGGFSAGFFIASETSYQSGHSAQGIFSVVSAGFSLLAVISAIPEDSIGVFKRTDTSLKANLTTAYWCLSTLVNTVLAFVQLCVKKLKSGAQVLSGLAILWAIGDSLIAITLLVAYFPKDAWEIVDSLMSVSETILSDINVLLISACDFLDDVGLEEVTPIFIGLGATSAALAAIVYFVQTIYHVVHHAQDTPAQFQPATGSN